MKAGGPPLPRRSKTDDTPSARFNVVITNIRAENLSCEAATRTRNPYFKLNFDNKYVVKSEERREELSPSWPEQHKFEYESRYLDCFQRKFFVLEVFDRNVHSVDELIGAVRIDLHTIASGATSHRLPLRDNGKHRGTILFDATMEQVATVEVHLQALRVAGLVPGAAAAADLVLEASMPPHAVAPGSGGAGDSPQCLTSPPGAALGGWQAPAGVLRASGTLRELLAAHITISVRRPGGGDVLATGRMPISAAYTLVPRQAVALSVALTLAPEAMASGAFVAAGAAPCVTGAVFYVGMPAFVQMLGGVHTEEGITGATYAAPLAALANRPVCPVAAVVTVAAPPPRLPGGPHRGTGDRPPPAGGTSASHGGGVNPSTGIVLTAAQYAPAGTATPPPPEERLFAGAPGLPACWVRRVLRAPTAPTRAGVAPPPTATPSADTAAAGRVVFENLLTGAVVSALPTEPEYLVTLPPSTAGVPVGVALEANFSGITRFGTRSGRRNSGFDIGAVVRTVTAGGALISAPGGAAVAPGHHLIAINGSSTLRMTFDETVAALRSAGRPLLLRFADPYAVPATLAAAAANAAATPETLAPAVATEIGRLQLPSAPSVALEARPGAGEVEAAVPPAALAASRKGADAEAARTLDLALDALSHLRATVPAAQAAAAAGGEEGAEAAAWLAGVADPVLHRVVTAAITGHGTDVLPDGAVAAARKFAASRNPRGGAALAVDEEDDAGDPPATNDATAVRALGALSALTGTDAAGLADEAGPVKDANVNAAMRPTALASAGTGGMRRAIETIKLRSAAFAGSAVRTVHTIMRVYKLGAIGAGLDQSSLVAMQAAGRKAGYSPVMAEAGGIALTRALADAFPHQDGAGFLVLVRRALDALAAMRSAGCSRARAPDGATYYVVGGGGSAWAEPPSVAAAMGALVAADRASRVLDDASVQPAPEAMVTDLRAALAAGAAADVFIAAALLSCAAKLAAHPSAATLFATRGVLPVAEAAAAAHEADVRIAEAVPALLFNVGRDLDASEALLSARAVPRVISTTQRFMKHYSSSMGSPVSWPPAGHEEKCGEVVLLEGNTRYVRDRNAVRPRLVRVCINVLINLACFRQPLLTPNLLPPVDAIAAEGGVALLGRVVSSHLAEPAVVTAALNAAANIAFKNRAVQLAIGETMMEDVLMATAAFTADAPLLSMALRTIGNLTNQDANIYMALGYGIMRLIAAGVREHADNAALAALAASVLSNIASVEPAPDAAASEEYASLFSRAWASRKGHHSALLRPSAAEIAAVERCLAVGRPIWGMSDMLCVEEGGVDALAGAMVRHSTEVPTVEGCLRALHIVAAQDPATAAAAEVAVDLTAKTLFVMRASDFDVSVQLAGAALLQALAASPAAAPRVVASDAALTLCMAIDTHKSALLAALAVMSSALSAAATRGKAGAPSPAVATAAIGSALEGSAGQVLQLVVRACDTLQALASPRAVKALLETGTPMAILGVLSAAAAALKLASGAGIDPVATSVSADAGYNALVALVSSTALALSSWLQAPLPVVATPTAAEAAAAAAVDAGQQIRRSVLSSERAISALVRLAEACVRGSGEAGDPARTAMNARPARAILDLLASAMFTSPVLPGRASASYVGVPGAQLLVAASDVGYPLVRAGALRHLGAMLLAYVAVVASPAPLDGNMLASRLLTAQLLMLVDAAACCVTPGDANLIQRHGGRGGGDAAGNEYDPLAMGAGITSAASSALSRAHSAAGPAAAALDLAPPPMRMADVTDLASRVATHVSARAEGRDTAGGPATLEAEAAAVFSYSLTRAARQIAATMRPGPPPAAAATARPGALPPPPPPGSQSGALPPPPPHGQPSHAPHQGTRAILGHLGSGDGWACTAWMDGKSFEALAVVSDDGHKLQVHERPKLKLMRGSKVTDLPLICALRGTAFSAVRIGERIKARKVVRGGIFGKAANPKRTVCLDTEEDTLMQLEAADEADARSLLAALQGFLTIQGPKSSLF